MNRDPHVLARDWIDQVLEHSPPLQAKMKKYMDDHRTIENICTEELWQDLLDVLTSMSRVYCIVDALDEMDIDKADFLNRLVDLGKLKPPTIKVLMTSRPLPHIEVRLKDSSVLQLRLEQHLVDKDITVYVDHRLQHQTGTHDELWQTIKLSIRNRAQGSFLYTRLIIDEVLDRMKQIAPGSELSLRSLDWLPVTLENMYNRMLLDHLPRSQVSQELQMTILQWVTHSSRPLRLLEISTMLDFVNRSKEGEKDMKAIARRACGPLLEILEDETVSVIHHSFTEFLIDKGREQRSRLSSCIHPQFPVISPSVTHRLLALTCLEYLTTGCLSDWEFTYSRNHFLRDMRRLRLQYPFLDYAANNWYVHIRNIPALDDELCDKLDAFLNVKNRNFCAWVEVAWNRRRETDLASKLSPLHVAAWAGMANYVPHAIQLGYDSNGLDGQERTPLSWASARGHAEVVSLLLENRANADTDDYFGLKPLHYAAQANHYKIVKLLMEAGVDPMTIKTKEDPGRQCGNAPFTRGETPLLYTCRSGCTESVCEMIPYLNPDSINYALRWAAKEGKTQVVDLLLAAPGVMVDPSGESITPLVLAASGLHLTVMHSLLKKGADPNKRSRSDSGLRSIGWYGKNTRRLTPLHAIFGPRQKDDKNLRIVFIFYSTLVAMSTPLTMKAKRHSTIAYQKNMYTISALLLENGADPMAKDKFGNTPLHLLPLCSDSANTVKLLLTYGADINTRRPSDGRTPVHTALDSIHELHPKVLIPYVSDWNVSDLQGNTPLHIILSRSYSPVQTVEELLEVGADPNRKNKKGETPLYLCTEYFNSPKQLLDLLLSAGADLEAKDRDGWTILLQILHRPSHKSSEIARVLVDLGADLNAHDYKGNGVLHTVCQKLQDPNLFQFLVNAGADPFCVNDARETLLHTIAKNYPSKTEAAVVEILHLLLTMGISPATQNNLGQTALHFICGTVPRPISAKGLSKDLLQILWSLKLEEALTPKTMMVYGKST